LNSLVIEGKWGFNLLEQELHDEKHASASLSQYIKTCKLEKAKYINDACATNYTSWGTSISK
jgi:hypothetical protein